MVDPGCRRRIPVRDHQQHARLAWGGQHVHVEKPRRLHAKGMRQLVAGKKKNLLLRRAICGAIMPGSTCWGRPATLAGEIWCAARR